MKRVNGIYDRICAIENLELAEAKAMKRRVKNYGVQLHLKKRDANIALLQMHLQNGTYKTSPYKIFKIYEPKERLIYRLPFFPDRICHHAIMNILEPIWVSIFTRDTYSCIKGRGIHGVFKKLKADLKDIPGTKYCLKLDIRKFYQSIDHEILKTIIRKKIKDTKLLKLLDEVIDSAPGVPIGNYLSQYFANLYLAYFDHWMKEDKGVKYYYRYADDIVVLSDSKQELHTLFTAMRTYLQDNLKLELKPNYQVFPVSARSIDFIGYRFYHTHILLRKSIKKSMCKAFRANKTSAKAAYAGWAIHADCKNLLRKIGYEKV